MDGPKDAYLAMVRALDDAPDFDRFLETLIKWAAGERTSSLHEVKKTMDDLSASFGGIPGDISRALLDLVRSGRKRAYDIIDIHEEKDFMSADVSVKYADGTKCAVRMFDENGWKVASEIYESVRTVEKRSIVPPLDRSRMPSRLEPEKALTAMKRELYYARTLRELVGIMQKYGSAQAIEGMLENIRNVEGTAWAFLETMSSYPEMDAFERALAPLAMLYMRSMPPFSKGTMDFTIKGNDDDGSVATLSLYYSTGASGAARFVKENGIWRFEGEWQNESKPVETQAIEAPQGQDENPYSQYMIMMADRENIRSMDDIFVFVKKHLCSSKLRDLEMVESSVNEMKRANPDMYAQSENTMMNEFLKAYANMPKTWDTVDTAVEGDKAALMFAKEEDDSAWLVTMVREGGKWKLDDESLQERATAKARLRSLCGKDGPSLPTSAQAEPPANIEPMKIDIEAMQREIMALQAEYQAKVQEIVAIMQRDAQQGKDISQYQMQLQGLGQELANKCQEISTRYSNQA